MATMIAARYYGRGDIRVERVPRPVPGPGEVLVHVNVCGICGSDLRLYQQGEVEENPRIPRTLGHELAGDVVELGAGVAGLHLGDRVAAAPVGSCGRCFYCQHGSETLCLNKIDFGLTHDAGFAEYVLYPALFVAQGGLVAIPDDMSCEKASLIEPLGCCLRGLHTRGRLKPGETVVIIGDGPIGLIQVMLARYLGASTVICAGHHEERLAEARRWGAHITVDTHTEDLHKVVRGATGDMGADLVVVSVPSLQAIQEFVCLVRGGGRFVIFGGVPQGSRIELDPNLIHYREIDFTGSFNCTVEEYRRSFDIARNLPVDELITHRVPLQRIHDGFSIFADRIGLKVLVVVSEFLSP
jgi:L-iditol 2-dehydrogenase